MDGSVDMDQNNNDRFTLNGKKDAAVEAFLVTYDITMNEKAGFFFSYIDGNDRNVYRTTFISG